MKTIWMDICNSLMAASVHRMLDHNNQFHLCEQVAGQNMVDVALMEVSHAPGCAVNGRLTAARKIRAAMPGCTILFLCDENSAPEMARQVVTAKKDGEIDDFVYSSVSESYFAAMLAAI